MITINLLPEELKKKESSFARIGASFKGQIKLFRNIGYTVILILVAAHTSLFVIGHKNVKMTDALFKKSAGLAPAKKEYTALKAEAALADRKARAIDALMTDRFSWAKLLNGLSESVIPGIWLTGLSYQEVSGDKTVPAAGYLDLSGYASSMGEEGTALVGRFIKDMKDNPLFFSDFSEIKLESIKSEKYLDQEVMSFKITCLFK